MIDGEHLFDPGQYPQVPRKAVPGESELAAAVALDRKPQLIHEGGELWTRRVAVHSADKAYYAHYYADIVGTGMRTAYPGPRAWVELFAGPGRLFVEGEDRHRPGSPVEALDIRDRFDIYFFADLDERCTRSLHARLGQEPNVHVHRGDANAADLHDKMLALIPRNALVVLYADPQGLDLHFDTIRFFAERYKHLDLLVNFPAPGVVRA